MMTIISKLCALCAVCTLCETALPEDRGREGLRMIGGLLMLKLVLSQGQELLTAVLQEKELMRMLEALLK